MKTVKHFIELTIPVTLIVVGMSSFAGGLMAAGSVSLNRNFIFSIAAFILIMAAFNTINGIFDIKLDKISKPHRPLPSSKITRQHAWRFYVALAVISSALAYAANTYVFILVLGVIILSILYSSPIMWLKRHLILNTTIVTACYSVLPLLAGWVAFASPFSIPVSIFVILGLTSFGMVIVKDIEDMVADKVSGVMTIPIVLGLERTVYFLGILFSFAYILISYLALTKVLFLISLVGYLGMTHLLFSIKKNPYPRLGKYFLLEAIFIGLTVEVLLAVVYIL
ncbi:MAG: UbiA family prenyltransferase [Candidatus Aenigmarchaeota archaeon]|nr:UbiA family prenyltransferase [Candidatus Aenigmarchaeota archaeon]